MADEPPSDSQKSQGERAAADIQAGSADLQRCPVCGRYTGDAPMAGTDERGCPRCGMWLA